MKSVVEASAARSFFTRTSTSSADGVPSGMVRQDRAVLTSEEQVEADDRCWAQVYSEADSEKEFLDRHAADLCRTAGRWYFDSEAPAELCAQASKSEKFMLALAKAGMLDGRKTKRNEQEALVLLDEVEIADPGNSAPLLYKALIYRQQGRREDEARVIERLGATTRFDSYLKNVTRTVYEQVQTPSDYLNALALWGKAPVPDYNKLSHFLVDHQLGHIADQMLEDSRGGADRRETRWIAIEAAIGVSVLKKTEPGRRDLPDVRAMMAEAQSQGPAARWGGSPPSGCRLEDLTPQVELLRDEVR